MKRRILSWCLALALLLAMGVLGCGKKEGSESAESERAEKAKGEQTEHREATPIVPAATVPEIWAQIETERSILKTTVESGTLDEVQQLADRISGLVVAAAQKANAASPATAEQVNGMVDQVKASAAKLDELGDTGDRALTQAEFNKFSSVLDAFKNVVVGPS